jgi:hypothetical protein
LAAAVLWDGTGKVAPSQEVSICAAVKRVGKMCGQAQMTAQLEGEVLRRIKPHKDLYSWMCAKRPAWDAPTTAQVQAHRKEWVLKMAGPAPKATPQAYKPRSRRR